MANSFHQLQITVNSLRARIVNLAESEGEWKTINGRHVLVGKGETPLEALNKSLEKSSSTTIDNVGKVKFSSSDMGGYIAKVDGKTIGFVKRVSRPWVRGKTISSWKATHSILGNILHSGPKGIGTKASAMAALEKAHEEYLSKSVVG